MARWPVRLVSGGRMVLACSREPQQRDARSRCSARLFPDDQHLTDALLERLDALADRRRRDVQRGRRRIEAALLDDGGEGGQLVRTEPRFVHMSNANRVGKLVRIANEAR